MNLRPLGFLDVSRLAASYLLFASKEAADSRDQHHHGVRTLWLRQEGEDAGILTRDKPWKAGRAFLTKIRNETAPMFGGVAPVLGDVCLRSIVPGGRIDWHADHGEERSRIRQLHLCLIPSPGAWVYCGGEALVLNVGGATLVNHMVLHSEINMGPCTMTKAVVELIPPEPTDADA